ncbi:hypothetical protein F4824DRAFT_65974 [Ustulina deusta]|nr:hypothetical protein F4824DRAFT_65974 [Ustulina deusta]
MSTAIDRAAACKGRVDSHGQSAGTSSNGRLFQPSSTLMVFPPKDLPKIPVLNISDKRTAIANLEAFETWVALRCRTWSKDNLSSISCRELGSLIVTHHEPALPASPHSFSAMGHLLGLSFSERDKSHNAANYTERSRVLQIKKRRRGSHLCFHFRGRG